MSNKGKVFTANQAPPKLRETRPEFAQRWAEQQTERFRIVAYDRTARPDDQAIIAEEIEARVLRLLSSRTRSLVGTLLNAAPEVRAEVLKAFNSDGSLIIPFEMVKE